MIRAFSFLIIGLASLCAVSASAGQIGYRKHDGVISIFASGDSNVYDVGHRMIGGRLVVDVRATSGPNAFISHGSMTGKARKAARIAVIYTNKFVCDAHKRVRAVNRATMAFDARMNVWSVQADCR